MEKKEFSEIRQYLGKSQKQLGQILCVSTKAVQSFEQGWRNIPPYIERQILLLYSLKKSMDKNSQFCWEIIKCPDEWRDNCIVWELQAKHFCWFINGTFCQGEMHRHWEEKIKICRECEIFRAILEDSAGDYQTLDLASPLVDVCDTSIAKRFFYQVVSADAHATEYVHALLDGLSRDLPTLGGRIRHRCHHPD